MTSSLQLKARSVRIGKAGLTMILAGAAAFACGAPDVGVAEADLSAEMLATLTEEEKAALVSVANGMTNRVTETILIPDCYSQQEIGQGTATLPYSTSGSTTTSSSTSSESTLSGVYSANGWITDTTAAASGSQQGSTNQSTQSSFSQSGYRPVHFRDETTSSYCNGYIGSDKKFIAAVNEAKNTTRIPMTYLPKPRSEESALLVEKQKEFEVSIKWAECPKGEYAGDELLLTMCLEPKENTKKRYFGVLLPTFDAESVADFLAAKGAGFEVADTLVGVVSEEQFHAMMAIARAVVLADPSASWSGLPKSPLEKARDEAAAKARAAAAKAKADAEKAKAVAAANLRYLACKHLRQDHYLEVGWGFGDGYCGFINSSEPVPAEKMAWAIDHINKGCPRD